MEALKGKKFAQEAVENKNTINPFVADNIDFVRLDEGHVIYRMK